MIRRVLLAWEFGGGMAHIMRLAGVARHLQALDGDIELVFGLRDREAGLGIGLPVEQVIEGPRIYPKPGCPPFEQLKDHTNFGSIIGDTVLGATQDGLRYFEDWNRLIQSVRPDVIVADYAPVVTMLARGRVPAIACGNGYSLPPVNIEVFPPFTKLKRPPVVAEQELLERFNAVLPRVGAKTLDRLPQINEAEAYGLCTLPDFDPYAGIEGRDWLGAVLPGGTPELRESHAGGLAYFHQKQQFDDDLIDGLIRSGIEMDVFMGESMRRTRKRVQGSGVKFSDEPFELPRAMPGRAIAIHSGSLGFCAAAAFAGVPQVMMPKHQEHQTNAPGVVARNAGVIVRSSKRTPDNLAAVIREVAESETMREAARAFAVSLDPWRKADPTRVIAERALALLNINA